MKRERGIRQLKLYISVLIFGSILIGILSQLLIPAIAPRHGEAFYMVYLVFEHLGRGVIIIAGALTVYLVLSRKRGGPGMRHRSLLGFSLSALVLLCILPAASGFWEFYYVLMPFPWSTFPLQLLYDGHYLSADFRPAFGGNGVVVLLAFYAVFNAAVFSLVAVFGRRFFCSMLCVNFGAHAETLKEGFPLFGSRKRMKERYMPALRNLLAAAKWGFLAVNLLLMVLWAGILAGAALDPALLRTLELVKYLALELFLVLGAFVVLSGRTYCYYCPSGTMLSLAGKATGHGIRTNVSACIDCGRCNEVCDMEIDIRGRALQGEPVRSVLCVGCGACVDACPAGTLEYL